MTSSALRAQRVFLPPRAAKPGEAAAEVELSQRSILALWILHIPLGLALYNLGSLALIHPVIVFVVGMYWAVRKSVPIYKVALAVTYLVATEVLWRMAQTPIFWEFGKYGSVAMIVAALVARGARKKPLLPIVYFIALLPSCILTFVELSLSDARGQLSFTMSGPLALAASCVFFANTSMKPGQIKGLCMVGMAPIISIATATLFYTITTEDITFTTESNFATSGGFGPNQVSSTLGLGVFFAIIVLLLFKETNRLQKLLTAILAIFFAMQSVMTFSRSGIYNVIGATLVLLIFSFQNLGSAVKKTIPVIFLGVIFLYLVFPKLDDFTGGKLQARFEETGTSNRMEIIESDFAIFADNPVLGVGVGLSRRIRREYAGFAATSHTEFSRLISEHGTFGLVAIVAILAAIFFNFIHQRSAIGRALVGGLATWSCLYMMNAGMRLAAPGFVIGLTFITIAYPQMVRIRRTGFPRLRPGNFRLNRKRQSGPK